MNEFGEIAPTGSRKAPNGRHSAGFGGLGGVFALILIAGSATERLTLDVAGYSLYASHVFAFLLLPVYLLSMARLAAYTSAMAFLVAISLLGAAPSIIIYGTVNRLSYLLQLSANVVLFLVALGVFFALDSVALRRLVGLATVLIAIGAVFQVVIFPERSAHSGERFAALLRPVLLFSEPTWFAIFSAMLFAAALTLRMRWCAWIIAPLVIVVFTRSALVLIAAAILLGIPAIRGSKVVVLSIVSLCSGFAAWFAYSAFISNERVTAVSSLDTRKLDIFAVTAANGGALSWTGSRVVQVYDTFRNRLIPATSNVLSFDLYWKFGLGGLIVLGVWSWLVAWYLPRKAGASLSMISTLPGWVCLALLPAVMQLNNAFGRPWLWVMAALLLASIKMAVRESEVYEPRTVRSAIC